MATQKKRTFSKLSAEEFVVAWQQADSIEDVVKATGSSAMACHVRASKMRKKMQPYGVELKRFGGGGGTRLDYEALARLAKKHAPK